MTPLPSLQIFLNPTNLNFPDLFFPVHVCQWPVSEIFGMGISLCSLCSLSVIPLFVLIEPDLFAEHFLTTFPHIQDMFSAPHLPSILLLLPHTQYFSSWKWFNFDLEMLLTWKCFYQLPTVNLCEVGLKKHQKFGIPTWRSKLISWKSIMFLSAIFHAHTRFIDCFTSIWVCTGMCDSMYGNFENTSSVHICLYCTGGILTMCIDIFV